LWQKRINKARLIRSEKGPRRRDRDVFNRKYFIRLTFRRGLINEAERKAKSGRTGSKRAKRGVSDLIHKSTPLTPPPPSETIL